MIDFEIRDMTAADIGPVGAIYKAGGRGDRREFFEWVLANPATQPLVGIRNGSLVGTGMATINGRVGWVGSIFVDPTMRGQGYGRAITDAVCARLDAAGCETEALIASEYGKPLYVSMGFRVDEFYQILEAEPVATVPIPPPGTTLRLMRRGDVGRVCELDFRATGEDRRGLLCSLDGHAWVLEADGELLGFVGSILPDSGAVVAPKVDNGACLLEQLRYAGRGRTKTVRAAVPGTNLASIDRLQRLGWSPTFQTPRMLRGPDIPWEPALIWSILGFAFG